MSTQTKPLKCDWVGCKMKPFARIRQNWGKESFLICCEKHQPDWLKEGKNESPPVGMLGLAPRSWYTFKNFIR